VFDVDGVLSDASARQHHLEGPGRRDWQSFFEAAKDDALIDEISALTEVIDAHLVVVLLTARPTQIDQLTLEWLERHDVRWDLLVMRPEGDRRPSPDAKRMAVHELRAGGFDLRLAFDDDRRNVAMFQAEGVPCVYIHSGYYEA
jgi:hypothetical protein